MPRPKPRTRRTSRPPRGTGKPAPPPPVRPAARPREAARPAPAKPPAPAGPVRLQKLLAHAGVSSRRAAEELIRDGRVRVDGRVVTKMGVSVDPDASRVTVDGRPVVAPAARRYLLLNKPRGVLCTLADPEGRRTVRDLIPRDAGRVYPVGRLDWDAEGVLILTDDGELANRLMHPRYGVERTYHAKLKGEVGEEVLARLARGVHLEDGRARAENVRFLRRARENTWVALTLREGRHHEVKRIGLAVGCPVQRLRRVSYAGVELGRLDPGQVRTLTPREIAALRGAVGLAGGGGVR